MYLYHYGLKEKPFQISTDPKFLWLGEKHKEALATLKYGVQDNRGFLLMTGDVGTGKTTLINSLLGGLGDDTIVATIFDPGLDKLDFFNFIANAFDLGFNFSSKAAFLVLFTNFLYKNHALNRKVLLIIDESQRLNHELLEEIRLLSNIEKQDTKLLTIFFVGQNEFNDIVLENRNRALRQRITINYSIDALTHEETGQYIFHRLSVAGTHREVFNPGAVREVYKFSEGYPRLINIICDHALLTGYVQGKRTITAEIVKECGKELRIERSVEKPDTNMTEVLSRYAPSSLKRAAIYFGLLFLLLVFAALLKFHLPGPQSTAAPQVTPPPPTAPAPPTATAPQPPPPAAPAQVEKTSPVTVKTDAAAQPVAAVPAPKPAAPAPASDELEVEDLTQTPASGELSPTQTSLETETLLEPAPEAAAPQQPVTQPQVDEKPPPDAEWDNQNGYLTNLKKLLPPTTQKQIVRFSHNTNELPAGAFETLDRVAAFMLQNRDSQATVAGFTDNLGGWKYNMSLSKFRANIVKSYLVGKGIEPNRIEALGMGPLNPIKSNDTAAGRNANRRVEIEVRVRTN